MDRFDAMQIFVRVVEKGSFSAVAKETWNWSTCRQQADLLP